MSSSKFTFCIPNRNKIDYLPACIEGMLRQEYADWRCLFVDGDSQDGSWEYMQQFASDPRFVLRRGLGQGMYADWNECLKGVETEYFYFLTSDDTCSPQLASTTIAALDEFSGIDACHFQFDCIDESGTIVRPYHTLIKTAFGLYSDVNQYAHLRSGLCEFMMHFVYRAMYQTITSLVFRQSLIEKMGGFSTEYGAIGDYDWTMRLGLFTDILYIPERLATWRIHADQATEDAMLPHITHNLLAIAQKNLAYFQHMALAQQLAKPLCDRQVLADLRDEHACALYRSLRSAPSLRKAWEAIVALIQQAPLYPIQKILNRMSQNRVYAYRGRTQFAEQLIQHYELPWTPVLVEIPSIQRFIDYVY